MSDIVERLRALARDYHQHRPHYEEAADRIVELEAKLTACYQMDRYKRIEALEAALREIAALKINNPSLSTDRMKLIARAALEPEQDR